MLWQGNNVETARIFSASTMIFSAKIPTAREKRQEKKD